MNYITKLLTLHNQLKIYHWQTDSYAAHQAFGGAYDELTGLIDSFIEEFMGENARIVSKEKFKFELFNIEDLQPEQFIENYIQYLKNELPKGLKDHDTNLFNIRDEMLSELQKLKYLLTLS
jgi:DNA-binding ferritin-like protein